MKAAGKTAVWGEGVPAFVPALLVFLGTAGLTAAAELSTGSSPSALEVPRTPPAATAVAAPPSIEAPVLPAPASSHEASTASALATTGAACQPLVVPFTLGAARPPIAVELELAQRARLVAPHAELTLLIHGHADAVGDEEGNLRLSRLRAKAIAEMFERGGVARSRMTVRGFGAFQPVEGAPETDGDNRRVVIHVRGAPCPTDFSAPFAP